MELEGLFSLAGTIAGVSWLTLAVTPFRWTWPKRVVGVAVFVLAAIYVALIVSFWSRGEGGFDSLSNVARLFEEPGLLLAGWVHYLAFDLLIGLWERGEAARLQIHRLALIPCLFLTFMFGPAGWLLFMAARRYKEVATS